MLEQLFPLPDREAQTKQLDFLFDRFLEKGMIDEGLEYLEEVKATYRNYNQYKEKFDKAKKFLADLGEKYKILRIRFQ